MMKNKKINTTAAKTPLFKKDTNEEEHGYAIPMDIANASQNKRERGNPTPTNTPEKAHMDKKAKSMAPEKSAESASTSIDAILDAIDLLRGHVDDRMDELGNQMKQHSAMLATIAKTVQLNSEELKECKTKMKNLEKQVEVLRKENYDVKERILDQERYKRRWNLRIKGKKENPNENIKTETVNLLTKIAPDLKNLEDAVDIVHRVGKMKENGQRQILILFTKRAVRDDIWKRTKKSPVCKEEGIRFAEDLTREDWLSRQAMWPKIDQARKAGKAAGFRGPYGFIEGKRITNVSEDLG